MAAGPFLFATGFVADRADEGSLFPSAGGSSALPEVQAVYWRCIAVLFYGARLNNPSLRLALFTNATPPLVDGVDIDRLLGRLGVERIMLPLTHRLPAARARSWGSVFYFLDILEYLAAHQRDGALALVDSDVVVTASVHPLFDRIRDFGIVGYRVDTPPESDINGLSPVELGRIATGAGDASAPAAHYGGELLGFDLARAGRHMPALRELWSRALDEDDPVAAIRTEEHFWSVFVARHGVAVADAGDLIKRLWTSWRYNNVRPGDEALPIWHLPAEKRYGIADLFAWAARRDFETALPPAAFRAAAERRCAVPRKRIGKILHDGLRQLRGRLG